MEHGMSCLWDEKSKCYPGPGHLACCIWVVLRFSMVMLLAVTL